MENKILDYMQVLSKLRRIENISDVQPHVR